MCSVPGGDWCNAEGQDHSAAGRQDRGQVPRHRHPQHHGQHGRPGPRSLRELPIDRDANIGNFAFCDLVSRNFFLFYLKFFPRLFS